MSRKMVLSLALKGIQIAFFSVSSWMFPFITEERPQAGMVSLEANQSK